MPGVAITQLSLDVSQHDGIVVHGHEQRIAHLRENSPAGGQAFALSAAWSDAPTQHERALLDRSGAAAVGHVVPAGPAGFGHDVLPPPPGEVPTDEHKTLNVPYDSGIVAVRDRAALNAAMGAQADYLIPDAAGDPIDRVPEMSRGSRGMLAEGTAWTSGSRWRDRAVLRIASRSATRGRRTRTWRADIETLRQAAGA